ncbi:MAG: immunoglobulin domain-containing protein [Chitinispirillaceae bacterium]|nr:immunoglobulin domain-containing protein [Chitinispirillaceae bacterium]
MRRVLCIFPMIFILTCKIVPHNPVDPDDETYIPPKLLFTGNNFKDGDTIATEEVVWSFNGSLGSRNQYRYKIDDKNWSEWKNVKNSGSEVRFVFTRNDTGKHTVSFQSCYHPNNNDFTDTSFSFFKINRPIIILEPLDQIVTEGQPVTFTMVANGTNLLYQWQKKSIAIHDANGPTLTVTSVSNSDNGAVFNCIVKNSSDTVVSNGAVLTVVQNMVAPIIAVEPTDQAVTEGNNATFTVIVTGTSLKYQWLRGAAEITGANSATYTLQNVTLADDGAEYHCIISNIADTAKSRAAKLTVAKSVAPPAITAHPSDVRVKVGEMAAFGVTATGTDLKYRWQKGTVDIPGATTSSYTIPTVNSELSGSAYRCVVSNSADSVVSNAALLTVVFNVTYIGNGNESGTVPSDTAVYSQNEIVRVKDNTGLLTKTGYTFSGWDQLQNGTGKKYEPSDSLLMGTHNVLLYAQWRIDSFTVSFNCNGGSEVASEVVAYKNCVTEPVAPIKSGYVFAGWFSNQALTTAFDFFMPITVSRTLYANWHIAKPSITTQPQTFSVYPLDTISFSVTAEGIGLTYQWQMDGAKLPGAVNAVFTIKKVKFSDSGYYQCEVSNESGSTLSSLVKLTVKTTLKDADSNEYPIVVIGNQVWTAENLRTTKFNDGTSIPHVEADSVWNSIITPGFCYYNNTNSLIEQRKWGALYNWTVVNTGKLAPSGWHVPTHEEWDTLENYLTINGLNVGKSLAAKTDWTVSEDEGDVGNDLSKNNQTVFTALPGGYREGLEFLDRCLNGYWWCSDEYTASVAEARAIYYDSPDFGNGVGLGRKHYGFSVRLIKD